MEEELLHDMVAEALVGPDNDKVDMWLVLPDGHNTVEALVGLGDKVDV